MKNFILLGIILMGLVSLNGCNTVKGAANGFNQDMDNLTGTKHNHTTTYHNTNTNSSVTSS